MPDPTEATPTQPPRQGLKRTSTFVVWCQLISHGDRRQPISHGFSNSSAGDIRSADYQIYMLLWKAYTRAYLKYNHCIGAASEITTRAASLSRHRRESLIIVHHFIWKGTDSSGPSCLQRTARTLKGPLAACSQVFLGERSRQGRVTRPTHLCRAYQHTLKACSSTHSSCSRRTQRPERGPHRRSRPQRH